MTIGIVRIKPRMRRKLLGIDLVALAVTMRDRSQLADDRSEDVSRRTVEQRTAARPFHELLHRLQSRAIPPAMVRGSDIRCSCRSECKLGW
jgi:hypothetical protein